MHFGEKLLALRRQKGMSQEALAAELGVSRQAVSKWELGDAMPDVENILKLSELFDVSTDYLLRDDVQLGKRPQAGPVQEPPKKSHGRARRIAGIASIAAGALGNLVIYVLSTMIRVPVPGMVRDADGMVKYVWDGRQGYSYKYFVDEYRLDAILTILALLILGGAAVLLWEKRNIVREKLKKHIPEKETAF